MNKNTSTLKVFDKLSADGSSGRGGSGDQLQRLGKEESGCAWYIPAAMMELIICRMIFSE